MTYDGYLTRAGSGVQLNSNSYLRGGGGGGAVPPENLDRGVRPAAGNPSLFQTKVCDFPLLYFRPNPKFHILFQTRPKDLRTSL